MSGGVANMCGRLVAIVVDDKPARKWTTWDTVSALLLVAVIAAALSFAAACDARPLEYLVAVLFPVEYCVIKLVTDCKGTRVGGVILVES